MDELQCAFASLAHLGHDLDPNTVDASQVQDEHKGLWSQIQQQHGGDKKSGQLIYAQQ